MAPRQGTTSPTARVIEPEASPTQKTSEETSAGQKDSKPQSTAVTNVAGPSMNSMYDPMGMNSNFGTNPMFNTALSPYGGMMGGAGLFGSPFYGGGGIGPFSGLNQFLFGVQNVIFSLSQAVQILGMNTQALHQLLESGTQMVDHAIATWHEMQTLDQIQRSRETEEEKKRRRRLRAMRWALVLGVSYAGYKIVRYILSLTRRKRLTGAPPHVYHPPVDYGGDPYHMGGASSLYRPANYGGMSPYGGYSPYGSGMY